MSEASVGRPESYEWGAVIPYRNPAALVAYYCGVFSLIPLIGLVVAIPGFILGIIGLRKRKSDPLIKGAVHAWVGIVLGGLMTVAWGALVLMMIAGIAAAGR